MCTKIKMQSYDINNHRRRRRLPCSIGTASTISTTLLILIVVTLHIHSTVSAATFPSGGTDIDMSNENKNDEAEEFCREKEWNYRDLYEMAGSEDQCVIVLSYMASEAISRPHNLLVVVTCAGHW